MNKIGKIKYYIFFDFFNNFLQVIYIKFDSKILKKNKNISKQFLLDSILKY
jgi:hypothetical protein